MDETELRGLIEELEGLADPDSERNPGHARLSSVMIAIGGAISGWKSKAMAKLNKVGWKGGCL